MTEVYKKLSKNIVVDSTQLKKLSAEDIGKNMQDILSHGLDVTYVDNIPDFIKVKSILSDLYSGKDITLRLEAILGEVTEDTIKKLTKYTNAHKDILNIIESIPKPKWDFQNVPKDGIDKYHVTKSHVSRHSHTHKIAIKTLEKIWNWVSNMIADEVTESKTSYNISKTYRIVWNVTQKNITIGCQNIQLWEIEQFALKFGWEFPA